MYSLEFYGMSAHMLKERKAAGYDVCCHGVEMGVCRQWIMRDVDRMRREEKGRAGHRMRKDWEILEAME